MGWGRMSTRQIMQLRTRLLRSRCHWLGICPLNNHLRKVPRVQCLMDWVVKLLIAINDWLCFGGLLQEEGAKIPLHIKSRSRQLTQLLINRTGWLLGEEGEKISLCIKLKSSQLMHLLIDITGWLLGEEGERIPLWIELQSSWSLHLFIDRTGWLLEEEGERIPLHIML